MRGFKALFAIAAMLLGSCAFAHPKRIAPPSGFDGQVYNGAMALYASSESAGVSNRFICSTRPIKKVKGGYELLSAGHCTPANIGNLPPDMTFAVATDLGGKLMPVKLVAAQMTEPVDWAIFYLPTKMKLPVISLGDERDMSINDPTIDVNFSLGVAKEVSMGVVSSQVLTTGDDTGFFEVTQFASHGASGSCVISERTHKVIGIVIAGYDGQTLPELVEPISVIKAAISPYNVATAPAYAAPVPAAPEGGDAATKFFRGANHRGDNRRDTHRAPRTGVREHRDPRGFDGHEHCRVGTERDIKGRIEIQFFDVWFATVDNVAFPDWIFTDEVTVAYVGGNTYVVSDWENPAMVSFVVMADED